MSSPTAHKPRPLGWGTWNPDRPAELVHPETGFALTPLLYSARANRVSRLTAGPQFRFGPRSPDGGTIAFEVAHEDTRLRWRYGIHGAAVTVDWTALAHGEWGLRFWLAFGVSGGGFVYDRHSGLLRGENPAGRTLQIHAEKDPLLVTVHDGPEALIDEFESRGYFYLGSRGESGSFVALRFNLEEAPRLRLAATLDPSPLPRPQPAAAIDEGGEREDDDHGRALRAIYDVIAWNRVLDPVNRRPYTVLTRHWNRQKFGGFGVWLNDVLYNALLWSLFDGGRARDDLDAVLAWQTEDGNLPCLVTGNDAWLDRSQPPIAAYILWTIAAREPEPERAETLLRTVFPALLANHDWWRRRRRLADTGLFAYGTSLDIGDGLYKGTKLAAKDESSMDNSPVHDPARYDPQSGLLQAADVGLNSLLALDGEMLALIAERLGERASAARLRRSSEELRERVHDSLWDAERQVFANRLLDGGFVDALAPTSFYPLAAGAADPGQTAALIERYLRPPQKFGGRYRLPSVARDHPAYQDNVYWRGRIWAPLNFWVYQGLRRSGEDAEASALAAVSLKLFARGWRERLCGENYNADSGLIADQPDSDSFYSWGALLALLGASEVCELSPWRGMSLAPARVRHEFGPLRTPLGSLRVRRETGHNWRVERDGSVWLEGNLQGELGRVEAEQGGFSARLPARARATFLRLPGATEMLAEFDGVAIELHGDTALIPAGAAGRLKLHRSR